MSKSIKRKLTRQLILDQGLALFLQNGYQATSLDDILSDLQLTKGAFYYHFSSKANFLLTIIKEVVSKKVYSELITPLDESGNPVNLIFDAIEKSLVKLSVLEKRHGFMLSNFFNEFASSDTEIATELKSIITEWQLGIVKCLQRGKTSNFISRHVDSEAVSVFIISSYLGVRTLKKGNGDETIRYKYLTELKKYLNNLQEN